VDLLTSEIGKWATTYHAGAPPDNRPARSELDNCRPYLETELRLLDRLEVAIALGRIAHDAYIMASRRVKELPKRGHPAFAHGMEAKLPEGITLIDSYHPSRQNTNTGRLTRPMLHAVFRRAREIARDVRSDRHPGRERRSEGR